MHILVDGNTTEPYVFLTMYVESSYFPAKTPVQDRELQQQELVTSQPPSSVGKHCAQVQGMCSFAGERLKVLAGN